MPDSPQAGMLTREDLRSELCAFAAESFQAELSNMASRLQRGIHSDVQQMLVDLRYALEHPGSPPRNNSRPHTCNSDLRTIAAKDNLHSYPSAPNSDDMPTVALPGAVAPSTAEVTHKLVISAKAFEENRGEDDEGSEMKRQVTGSSDEPISPGRFARQRSPTTDRLDVTRSQSSRTRGISSAKRARGSGNGGQLEKIGHWLAPSGNTPFQRKLLFIVNHNYFDYVVAALILLNGIMVGIQTDYLAREKLDEPPLFFQVVEVVFCLIFTAELALRLTAFRCGFFFMSQRAWNWFDFIIVSMQLLEIIMSLVADGVGLSFNILRILRLIRVVRLARALRLIGELRTIVSSIAGSVKPLFWTGVLLFLIAYVIGVALTQLVHTKRLLLDERGEHIPVALDLYWGDLISAIFTLILAITGGVDWDDVCRPLMDKIGVEVGVLFTCYILFSSLAMLNVVTGVFIDSVMENGRQEKEHRTMDKVQTLFQQLDVGNAGEIDWEAFKDSLDKKEMKDFFKIIDVHSDDAKQLFELLDIDDSGSVDKDEFMEGCLRIWSPAKGIDLRMLKRDIVGIAADLKSMSGQLSFLEAWHPSEPLAMNGIVEAPAG